MDYKNRIPGYRPPRPPRQKNRTGIWITLALAAGVAGVGGWYISRPKEVREEMVGPPAPVAGQQAHTSTSPLALPDPNAKPTEAKGSDKSEKKAANPKEIAKPDAKETTQSETAKPAATPPQQELRFTFYKILPEKEAIVAENEIKDLKKEEKQGKKPPEVKYVLQAGSFSNVQDADKLKARLSSLKIKSNIENVKIENATWNRVKIGPFSSMADADRVRTYLKKNQIDSVVQKSVTSPQTTAKQPVKH